MKKTISLLIIVASLIVSLACQVLSNLTNKVQTENVTPTVEISIPTEIVDTAMPIQGPTLAPVNTDIPSTFTATPAVVSDITNTPAAGQQSCADVFITVKDTSKGDYLEICADGKEYEVGPLEKGGYAIGPNKLFFVYAANSGTVYAARIGDTRLTVLGDIKDFLIVKQGKTPQFEFQFFGDHPYTVEVHETVYNQKKLLPIPRRISAPN